tara:strand:- start:913 stop:1107 length:195 start_codon:yes stop_codon:yes gene_type:complete
MVYTAVFQDQSGQYTFEDHIAAHDRTEAWHEIYEKRTNADTCLVLLIDGKANVKRFEDIVDLPF